MLTDIRHKIFGHPDYLIRIPFLWRSNFDLFEYIYFASGLVDESYLNVRRMGESYMGDNILLYKANGGK